MVTLKRRLSNLSQHWMAMQIKKQPKSKWFKLCFLTRDNLIHPCSFMYHCSVCTASEHYLTQCPIQWIWIRWIYLINKNVQKIFCSWWSTTFQVTQLVGCCHLNHLVLIINGNHDASLNWLLLTGNVWAKHNKLLTKLLQMKYVIIIKALVH